MTKRKSIAREHAVDQPRIGRDGKTRRRPRRKPTLEEYRYNIRACVVLIKQWEQYIERARAIGLAELKALGRDYPGMAWATHAEITDR